MFGTLAIEPAGRKPESRFPDPEVVGIPILGNQYKNPGVCYIYRTYVRFISRLAANKTYSEARQCGTKVIQ